MIQQQDPHRNFNLAVCSHANTFLPLCTCCIAVSRSSFSTIPAFPTLLRAYDTDWLTELRLVDINDSCVSVMYGRVTQSSIAGTG